MRNSQRKHWWAEMNAFGQMKAAERGLTETDVAQVGRDVRRERADFEAFDRVMQRQGGEPLQPDDLIP